MLAAAGRQEALAQELGAGPPLPAEVAACARLRIDAERLACFDAAVGSRVRGGAGWTPPGEDGPPAMPAVVAGRAPPGERRPAGSGWSPAIDLLSDYWELDPGDKRGVFHLIGYRPNFFLPLHLGDRINAAPSSPTRPFGGEAPDYRRIEAKLQLSLRVKVVQGLVLPGADLWFAYTQQSLWQLWSGSISAPFRSTDHEPELIYVVPMPAALPLGWRLRMAGAGLAHQSNGRGSALSRSWNRVYAMAGAERGDLALVLRAWRRLEEGDDEDDNPDLTAYRGRGDVAMYWTPGRHTLSLNLRTNFRDLGRGSTQLDWTYPVRRDDPDGLRWYVQLFSGYGETLLDYNFRQTSLGAGVTLFGW